MNLSDYRSAVRLQLGALSGDAVLPPEVVDWGINGALRAIATEKDWPWLYTQEDVTLVADEPLVPLPNDYTRTVFITVDGRGPLEPVTHIVSSLDRTTTGRPNHYNVEADSLRLFPAPSSAYDATHAYYRSEPTLLTETDAPLLPDAYSERLVYEAAIKIAIRTNNLSRLQTLRDEATKQRKDMTDAYIRMNKPGRIRRTKESIWPIQWPVA